MTPFGDLRLACEPVSFMTAYKVTRLVQWLPMSLHLIFRRDVRAALFRKNKIMYYI
jgi:hypothetical protein